MLSPEDELKVKQILAQHGKAEFLQDEPSPLAAEQFRQKFSWGALFYNVVYYYSVKDWPFFWASLVCTLSIYLTPAIIPLAFFARRRAWEHKEWGSVREFEAAQRKWDRNGWIGAVVTILFLLFAAHYFIGALENGLGTSDPNQVLQQVQSYGQ